MRKYMFFSALALVIAAVSCQKAEENTATREDIPEVVNTQLSQFHASVVETKTYISGETSTHWATNDWISILKGSNNYEYGTSDYGATATFDYVGDGSAPEGIVSTSTWALYPYKNTATLDGTVINTWIAENQEAYLGNFSDQRPVLVARSDAQGNLPFKHASAVLKFTVDEGDDGTIADLWIKGNSGEAVAGDLVVDYDGTTLSSQVGTTTRDQIYITPAGGGNFAAGTYYVTAAPTTFPNGLYMEWSDPSYESGKVAMKKSTAEYSFAPGKLIDLGSLTKTSDSTGPSATLLSDATAQVGVAYTLRVQVTDNLKLGPKAGFLITNSAWSSYYTDIWDHSTSVSSSGNYYEFYTDGTGNWVFETTVTFAAAGNYVVGTQLYDYAGNSAWVNLNIAVTDPGASDTTPPAISLTSAATATVGTTYNLVINFSDDSGITTCYPKIYIYNGDWSDGPTVVGSLPSGYWDNDTSGHNWGTTVSGTNFDFTLPLTFPSAGTYNVYIYGAVADSQGNSTASDQTQIGTITVTDI